MPRLTSATALAVVFACAPSLSFAHGPGDDDDDAPGTPAVVGGAGAPGGGPTTPITFDAVDAVPLAIPIFSSHAGSRVKLYLDFNGDTLASWGSFSPGTTPAFDTDGNPAAFTQNEVQQMTQICQRVAEKYSPFDVDVTTVDPGNETPKQTQHVIVGGDGAWTHQTIGGLTTLGTFGSTGTSTRSWVFPGQLAGGNPKIVAECAAHEAAHAFGLTHQSVWSGLTRTSEYSVGDGVIKGPILGTSYFTQRGLWWYGTSRTVDPVTHTGAIQDDLAILSGARNGFGYRPDDHGGDLETAGEFDFPAAADGTLTVTAEGVIEQTSDVDAFHFLTGAGLVSFYADVAALGAMLDLSLDLYTANGTWLTSVATSALGETLSADLPAGSYDLFVRSAGNYGDVGQYTLTGNIFAVPEPAGAALLALASATCAVRRRRAAR